MKGPVQQWFAKILPGKNSESEPDHAERHGSHRPSEIKVEIPMQDGVARITGAQLKAIPLFADCTESFLEGLAAKFECEKYTTGRRVISKGDVADKFYILIRGEVVVSDTRANSDKLYLAKLNEVNCLGEIALVRGINRTADVETVTPCVFMTLGRQDFMEAIEAMPGLRKAVEEIIEERESADQRAELLRRLSEI